MKWKFLLVALIIDIIVYILSQSICKFDECLKPFDIIFLTFWRQSFLDVMNYYIISYHYHVIINIISFNISYHIHIHIMAEISRCQSINYSLIYQIITNVLFKNSRDELSLNLRFLYSFRLKYWIEFIDTFGFN